MPNRLRIQEVEVFQVQPPTAMAVNREPWVRQTIVRVRTSDPAITGLGCGTFAYRYRAVEAAIGEHLGPLVLGQDPAAISDIWSQMRYSGYWRNGPVLNNAIAAIDMALWDIKGKVAGLPCYELWGGKTRAAALAYQHVSGDSVEEVLEAVEQKVAEGLKVVRCQLGNYNGPAGTPISRLPGSPSNGQYFNPEAALPHLPEMFRRLREKFGPELGLLYDVHERLDATDALCLAKELEPYRPFFIEDPVAPEQMDWLRHFRKQTATKIAIGELFTHPSEIVGYAQQRLFDYLRVHLSMMGGITPMLKLAHLCEAYGIRTAWHGPPDLSLIGATAMVHLDLALPNFGVQEWCERSGEEHQIFPGAPTLRDGYLFANGKPGLGIEFNEEAAASYPPSGNDSLWLLMRRPDGSINLP